MNDLQRENLMLSRELCKRCYEIARKEERTRVGAWRLRDGQWGYISDVSLDTRAGDYIDDFSIVHA